MQINDKKIRLKIINKSEKILMNYSICLQIYMIPVLTQISFQTHNFFPVWNNLFLWASKKWDFQQIIGWKDWMGHDSVHTVTVSAVHPTTFSWISSKKLVCFSGISQPCQFFLKIPGISMHWSRWLFNHFSKGVITKTLLKIRILLKNNT